LEKKPVAVISASAQAKALNAESVTTIATGFLKRIGNKGGLKPKRVSLEEGTYTVEIEMKKLSAVVRVDSETREIKGYEIQPKSEETSSSSVSPKLVVIVVGTAVVIHIGLNFMLKMLGL
jgi:cobalamin biosynthesis Mg chelatase CobN